MDAVKKDPRLRLMTMDSLGYQTIAINLGNGPRAKSVLGSNALVRQALDRIRKRARGDASRARRPVSLMDLIGSAKGLYGSPDDVQNARDELRREWP